MNKKIELKHDYLVQRKGQDWIVEGRNVPIDITGSSKGIFYRVSKTKELDRKIDVCIETNINKFNAVNSYCYEVVGEKAPTDYEDIRREAIRVAIKEHGLFLERYRTILKKK